MSKISLYSNRHYCLSFGLDTVYLDVEIEITRLSNVDKEVFKARVIRAQLDSLEEAFPIYLVGCMSAEQLKPILDRLEAALLEEIEPSLYTLFYTGNIQDANPTD